MRPTSKVSWSSLGHHLSARMLSSALAARTLAQDLPSDRGQHRLCTPATAFISTCNAEGSLCLQVRPNILELQLQGRSKVNPHYLESYRTALQAAMLLPFGRRGTPHDRAGVLSLGQQPVLRAVLAAEGCAAVLHPVPELQDCSAMCLTTFPEVHPGF